VKKTILFVDNEPNIIQGLKRMLRSMRNEWEMFFAQSGEEALNILSQNKIDVIVADMYLPEINGVELLNKVMENYPDIVRIILSGHSSEDMNLRSAKVAHQYLVKPCDAELLKKTIKQVCLLRKMLRNEQLLQVVTSIKELPSLPVLYCRLLKEIDTPDTSLKIIGDIIAQDVAMTAKVLQFVNSAFFGLPRKVTSPHEAVIYLGLDVLKGLVLYTQIFSTFKADPGVKGFSLQDFLRHSLMVGSLAREIALSESADKKIADEASVAGMLHDIGKLLLLKSRYYQQVYEYFNKTECKYLDAEYEILGTSHAEIGAYLLGLWGIPEEIIRIVALHHCPEKGMDKNFTALTAVHAANAFVLQRNYSNHENVFSDISYHYLVTLKLDCKLTDWLNISENMYGKS